MAFLYNRVIPILDVFRKACMNTMSLTASKTLLKDQLFNAEKLRLLSEPLAAQSVGFDTQGFVHTVLSGYPARELSERIAWTREQLQCFLPGNYREQVDLILKALPAPCDPGLSDNDFGDFIYAVYGDFVAHYGCTLEDLSFSLGALHKITTRFSAEFALRPFLQRFPEATLQILQRWAQDPHYHVRRLVSEGTRPRLPWGKNVDLSWAQCEPLLTLLHADPTRFVQRSVANHLNDWSKQDPAAVLSCLAHWQALQRADQKTLGYLTRHALRTLVKQGHAGALKALGYDPAAKYSLVSLRFTSQVILGQRFEFEVTLRSDALQSQNFLVDYIVYYRNQKGELRPKVYKLKTCVLAAGASVVLKKALPFKPRSTRTLYAGEQGFAIQVNGQATPRHRFELVVPEA